MKFIPSRDLRIRPGQVWKQLRKEGELIVTSNGKPVALMVPVDDDFEESLHILRGIRAKAALRKLQEQAAAKGLDKTTMEEIDEVIRKSREEHKASRK
ncbi:MAG: type II toxin-antitoxin system prevent-host-death family antitoxin [Phycisphaerae bacterium]|nr:type II toxin-antitoxin system prevent-host-death family antitoxin [Phycisphaerae bacterium]